MVKKSGPQLIQNKSYVYKLHALWELKKSVCLLKKTFYQTFVAFCFFCRHGGLRQYIYYYRKNVSRIRSDPLSSANIFCFRCYSGICIRFPATRHTPLARHFSNILEILPSTVPMSRPNCRRNPLVRFPLGPPFELLAGPPF